MAKRTPGRGEIPAAHAPNVVQFPKRPPIKHPSHLDHLTPQLQQAEADLLLYFRALGPGRMLQAIETMKVLLAEQRRENGWR